MSKKPDAATIKQAVKDRERIIKGNQIVRK